MYSFLQSIGKFVVKCIVSSSTGRCEYQRRRTWYPLQTCWSTRPGTQLLSFPTLFSNSYCFLVTSAYSWEASCIHMFLTSIVWILHLPSILHSLFQFLKCDVPVLHPAQGKVFSEIKSDRVVLFIRNRFYKRCKIIFWRVFPSNFSSDILQTRGS